jgi:hypothetical protein
MNINLINGEFNSKEAFELISKMIMIMIKYHEGKITSGIDIEDLKHREAKIKRLQDELNEFKSFINQHKETISIESIIQINKK